MPSHKFRYTDLEPLEQNPLQGKYKILVVGTFNADIAGNEATWFYGRPENEFWCLFPRMLGEPTLHPVDRDEPMEELTGLWKQFCVDNSVVIVDLFKEVLADLPDHTDARLAGLLPGQYVPFDFEAAFQNCTFDSVIFTWRGVTPNTLTTLKNQYSTYFTARGSRMLHLLTPSNSYAKPRIFKLRQWRDAYENE